MPRGRMLNKTISIDEEVNRLSIEAALLFTWCLPHLDCKGRIIGTPENIKGAVVPFKAEFTVELVSKLLKEMSDRKLITIYNHGRYIQFNGFLKNQTINMEREARSIIPDP